MQVSQLTLLAINDLKHFMLAHLVCKNGKTKLNIWVDDHLLVASSPCLAGDIRGGLPVVDVGVSLTMMRLALPDRYLALVMPFRLVAEVTRTTVLPV